MAFAVLTRDRDDVEGYAAALAPLGLDVVAMPVTRFAPPPDPGALARVLATETIRGGVSISAILVTSPRAAHAMARALDARVSTGAAHALPDVWVIGPATQRACDVAKIRAGQPPGVKNARELAEWLVAVRDLRGKRVLMPRAEDGIPDAIDVLRAAGADVLDVIAYRTVPADAADPQVARGAELLRAGDAAVCAMFAPSQVTALASIVGALGALATRFCAIGETTAAALRGAGVAAVAVASAPTPEGMAQAVRSVYPPH